MNLILIGPQGCGKGTQAKFLIDKFQLHHLEVGSLIRDRAEQHDRKAHIIDHLTNQKGMLLPDGIVLDMIYDSLSEVGYDQILFDGFPRTLVQYQSLKTILEDHNQTITKAIYIHISDQEAINRLTKRGREDDIPEIIQNRLNSYHQSTQPVLEIMKQDGILIEINGKQSIETIATDINHHLSSLS